MKAAPISATDAAAQDPLAALAVGIASQLAAARLAIESSFSATGDRLIECTMDLNAVSAAHEGLPGALDAEGFAQAEACLSSISTELSHLSDTDLHEDETIGGLQQLAAGMADPLSELRKVMLLLEIIAAQAGILAAELAGDHGGLDAFTHDMVALANGATEGIAAFAKARGLLLTHLSGATAASKHFAATHADTLSQVRARLETHVESITRHRQLAGRQLADNGAATRRIAARVADVVSAMQIGDITRQRVEHVERGLELIVEASQHENGIEPDLRPATISRLGLLAEAQLRDTAQEYQDRTRFIAEALPQLADDTTHVLADGEAQARLLTTSSGDTLTCMIADLREVRRLFADFRTVHGETARTAQAVAAAIDDMVSQLGTIDRIERQIRMVSFNMAAQCSRLGEEGRAMMVITQQLRELAMRTEAAVGNVRDLLGKGAEAAATIVSGDERTAELARLDDATNASIGQIEAVGSEMANHARTLSERGPGALAILRLAARAATQLGEVGAELQSALDALAACDNQPHQGADCDPTLLDTLRRTYTMDSERRVHDQICGDGPSEAQGGATVQDNAGDEDDLLSALF